MGWFDGEELDDARFLSDSAHEFAVAEVDGIYIAAGEHFGEGVGEADGVFEISSGGGNADGLSDFVATFAEELASFFADCDDGFIGGLFVEPDFCGFEEVCVVASAESSISGDEDKTDFFDFVTTGEERVRWQFASTTNAQDKFVHFFAVWARFLNFVFGFGEACGGDQFHRSGDRLGVLCRTDALSNLLERCHSWLGFS